MGAAAEGAGGEKSFGLNIRLPFGTGGQSWIASIPSHHVQILFHAQAVPRQGSERGGALPGRLGTMDECFELLTLMQTGKSTIVPVILVESGPTLLAHLGPLRAGPLVDRRLIDPNDVAFYRIVDRVEDAVEQVRASTACSTLRDRRRQHGVPARAAAAGCRASSRSSATSRTS